jgi:hypothetical protein
MHAPARYVLGIRETLAALVVRRVQLGDLVSFLVCTRKFI